MSNIRAGYDVTELLAIEEATFGVKPTTGTWKPVWLTTNFDPKPQPQLKEKIGLGNYIPTKFVVVKKFAEATIEHDLLAKATSPAFEWAEFWRFAISDTAYGASFALSKHLKSFSLGAKLDVTTPEYWLMNGCKIQQYELFGDNVEDVIHGRANVLGQLFGYGTTDYISGSATRQALPTTDYIKFGDCDLKLAGSSVYNRINSWNLTVQRTLEKKGVPCVTGGLSYARFPEAQAKVTLKVNLDFDSVTELNNFLASTEFTAALDVPQVAAVGRTISLSGGVWREHSSPHREIDLIALSLTADFTGLAVTTQA